MSPSEARDVFKGSAAVHRLHNNGKRNEGYPGLRRPRQINTILPQGVGHLHRPERRDDGFPTGQLIRLKGFKRIFSRFDKLDVMFTAFIHFALIVEALR